MATYYYVGGTGLITATNAFSTSSGGAGNTTSSAFTNGDDVIFDANSTGTCTIPTGTTITCRSLDTNAHTGTLVQATGTGTINVGGSSPGASNIALRFGASTTLTLTGTLTINFVSTSSTTQSITTNGKTVGTLVFNGAGSNYQFADATTSTGSFTYTNAASVDLNSFTHQFSAGGFTNNANTRNLIFGTGILNFTLFGSTPWSAAGATNVTVTASVGAQINVTAANSPTINLGSVNYGNVAISHSTSTAQTSSITSVGATIYSYTRAGNASKLEAVVLNGNLTVTNGFIVSGNSTVNRIFVLTATPGVATTLTNNGSYTISNIDFMDITFAGSASTNFAAITGNSGDAGGNSGATFTTAAPQQHDNTAGNWSDSGDWTSRVPLPQDDVTFASGSGAISLDMPRLGKSIDFTNYSGTATWPTGLGQTNYGSFTLSTGMTVTLANTVAMAFAGRGIHTFTSAGKSFVFTNGGLSFTAPGGTYTHQDALSTNTTLTVNDGIWESGSFSVTCSTFSSNTGRTRTLNWGTSTVSLTSAGAATLIQCSTSAGLTNNATGATFTIANTSASTRTLALGTSTAWGTITYTVAGSTGQLTLTGIAHIDTLNFTDASNARTLAITAAATTNIVVRVLNASGASGRLITIRSTTGGTPAYLGLWDAVNTLDWLAVQDIFSTIPYKFYAGANSTNTSGNTNVIFTAPVAGPCMFKHGENNATTNSLVATIGYGKSVSAGNLIVATYASNANPGSVTTPSGYTLVDSTIQGTTGYLYTYYKLAVGGETDVTFATSNSVAGAAKMMSFGGFTGTPTLDVQSENSTAGATSLSTDSGGTGPSNTANPAIAIAAWGSAAAMGATVSFSNSFHEHRDSTQQNNARWAAKLLTSNAAVITLNTWTTSRLAVSQLLVFKDVAGGSNWTETPSDTITMSDAATKAIVKPIADTITLTDVAIKAMVHPVADTLSLTDAANRALGKAAADTLTLSDAVSKAIGLNKADTLTLSDNMANTLRLELADVLTMTDMAAIIVQYIREAADVLTLTDAVDTTASQHYLQDVEDTLNLVDSVSISFSGEQNWYERDGQNWYARDPQSFHTANPQNWYTKP